MEQDGTLFDKLCETYTRESGESLCSLLVRKSPQVLPGLLKRRARFMTKRKFSRRFRRPQLVHSPHIKSGQVVLYPDGEAPPGRWQRAIIVAVLPKEVLLLSQRGQHKPSKENLVCVPKDQLTGRTPLLGRIPRIRELQYLVSKQLGLLSYFQTLANRPHIVGREPQRIQARTRAGIKIER